VVHDGQVALEVRHGKAVDHGERRPGRAREPGRSLVWRGLARCGRCRGPQRVSPDALQVYDISPGTLMTGSYPLAT